MQRRQRNFGGRDHEKIRVRIAEHRVGELAELAGRPHRFAADQIGRRDLHVAGCGRAVEKNCASARESRAPFREAEQTGCPKASAARSKSRTPRASPISQCGFGSKSKRRGSPQVRTRTLERSSLPSGTESSSKFGELASKACSGDCSCSGASDRARSSSRAIVSERAAMAGRLSRAAAALSEARPISADRRFFSALACSAAVSAERYSTS